MMNELIIIKVGGALLQDEEDRHQLLKSFSAIDSHKILIHGGGREATDMLKTLGIDPVFHKGRRITDKETLDVVTMIYGGKVNKSLVAELQSLGVNAIGMSGADAGLVTATKRKPGDIDFGYVGDPVEVNTHILNDLLQLTLVPVICPLTHDGHGQLLNTNADTMASKIAVHMSKSYRVSLRFCFEFDGVLSDLHDPTSVIKRLNTESIEQARREGIISNGMLPKLENAIYASEGGVENVIICSINNLSDPSKATCINV